VGAKLVRHPGSAGGEALSLEAEAMRRAGGLLTLRYVLTGDVDTVRWPPVGEPERVDGLWRTTCLEAFVAGGSGEYAELNFAPSTRWAAYRFSGRRAGMAPADVSEPAIAVRREPGRLELRADVSGLPDHGPWRVGLTAVVEDVAGRISYWALAHPGDKPDFHHPDSFVLELPVP
jgi:hypothetical protein